MKIRKEAPDYYHHIQEFYIDWAVEEDRLSRFVAYTVSECGEDVRFYLLRDPYIGVTLIDVIELVSDCWCNKINTITEILPDSAVLKDISKRLIHVYEIKIDSPVPALVATGEQGYAPPTTPKEQL